MIFYTEPMMRNYVNSLPESKTFYIASYGFKKGLYNVPKHAKLLIGLPYFPDCTPDCPHCKQRREKNKESIISALTNYNYKLIDNIHLKLLITDNIAIIGSRNLTGSQYEDLSIGVEDPKMIKGLKEHFEYLWDKCKNLKIIAENEILPNLTFQPSQADKDEAAIFLSKPNINMLNHQKLYIDFS